MLLVTAAFTRLMFPLLAQVATPSPPSPEDAAGCAGCLGCGALSGVMLLVGIVLAIVGFVTWIALLVWVARDAKNRGMDNAVLWMIVVFFLHLVGFIVYLLSRPQGELVACPNCNNKKLRVAARCPHCGHAVGGSPAAAAV